MHNDRDTDMLVCTRADTETYITLSVFVFFNKHAAKLGKYKHILPVNDAKSFIERYTSGAFF